MGKAVADIEVDTNELQTNQSAWATATGFATEAKQDAQDAIITEARLSELDAATGGKMANQVDIIQTDTTTNIPATITTLTSNVATIDGIVDNIIIDTAELQTDWTNGGRLDVILDAILADTGTDGVVLTAAERISIADAILDRDMATGTDSGTEAIRTVRQALRSSRNKVSVAGGVLTVTKENDTTASWTAAVTTTAGDPISAVDPTDA